MTNFAIFTDAHLAAAEARYASEFEKCAGMGLLSAAETCHIQLAQVRAEIVRRAMETATVTPVKFVDSLGV